MPKQQILAEIKRQAAANDGKPLGEEAFRSATGIARASWFPHIWINWGDALEEAGFARNIFNVAIEEGVLLEKYALFARSLGHLPVDGELRRQKRLDPSFPTAAVFYRRYGGKENLARALIKHFESLPEMSDVVALCREEFTESQNVPRRTGSPARPPVLGYVYLIKSGRHYKIGRTNSIGRREWELGIKIPIPPTTIHAIETDDPVGVEAYWHRRFAEKRGEGEWFNLSAEDIAAFKRWRKIA